MATVLQVLGLCTVTNTRSKYYRAGARLEAKSNGRLSSSATAGLGHGHKHKDEASELVSDGGGHFFCRTHRVPTYPWYFLLLLLLLLLLGR